MRGGCLVALVLACNPAGEPSATTAAPPVTPAAGPDCAARVAAMRAALAHVASDAVVVPAQSYMQFPASGRGQKVATQHAVWLYAEGTVGFERVRDGGLAEALPPLQAALARPGVVLLIADRRVATATIRGLVEGLPPATSYALAVQPTDYRARPSPPIPAWLAAAVDLTNIPRAEHPARLGDATDRALADCDAARDAYAGPTASDVGMVEVLVRRVPAGLEACRCGAADVEALTAIVWTMVGNQGPTLGQIPLAVTRDPQAEAVTVATVGELAALAEARGERPFRLGP